MRAPSLVQQAHATDRGFWLDSGGYIVPFNYVATSSALARDEGLADELWELSEGAVEAAMRE